MAPYSPALGSSLSHESQAPPAPNLSTKLLSSLLSPQTQVLPLAKAGSIPIPMKARKLDYSPHISNTHGRRETPPRKWPAMSTILWSVLLVMLIGLSSSQFRYEKVGREQSILDVVTDAYFGDGIKINERDMGTKVYLVPELSHDLDMEMNMRRRQDDPTSSIAPPATSSIAPPIQSASAVVITSSTTSSSSARPTSSGFANADDVRDPTAVKPSDYMESEPSPEDTRPTDMPGKRHWGSRNRGDNLGRRSP